MEMQRGYNFVPEKMFLGIKSEFFQFCLIPSNHDDSLPSGKEIFVTSYI